MARKKFVLTSDNKLMSEELAVSRKLDCLVGCLERGFMTCESNGSEKKYCVNVKFQTLEEAQALHNALVQLTSNEKDQGRVPQRSTNVHTD